MYIPAHYLMEEGEELLSFLRQYPFATIVNSKDGIPLATHLPFVVRDLGEELLLEAHFARANEQWQLLEQAEETLVIFSEPHAYISPRHYEKEQNVPTWNYQAVHLYGKAQLVTMQEEGFALLERLITTFEQAYHKQWTKLTQAYKTAMLAGIVPFSVKVNTVQAKAKLSQNKSRAEQRSIAAELVSTTDNTTRELGEAMLRNITNPKTE